MIDQVKINGIRLNKNYVQVTQEEFDRPDQSCVPLYQTLASNKINMVSIVVNTMGSKSFISGSISSKYLRRLPSLDGSWNDHPDVCTISIYPHHYRLRSLGFLLNLMGKLRVSFQYMVSSNAMLTFVVDQSDCDAVVDIFSNNFDLPPSHVPFEQEENDELTQFLKRKYPETRATYVEEKIKTYGIVLKPDLNFSYYLFSFDKLARFGHKIQTIEEDENKFFHTSAYMDSPEQIHLFLLTGKRLDIEADQIRTAELLSFHGPHFGDRHSIISRALDCLSQKDIPVLQTGCTGASIGIILPEGRGSQAQKVLMDVFEIP